LHKNASVVSILEEKEMAKRLKGGKKLAKTTTLKKAQ